MGHTEVDHCFCGDFVTVRSLTVWLSTEYSVNGWYISSQLCSDQNTSRFGDGFQRFLGELSYLPMPRILLPAGMCSGVSSSYSICQLKSNFGTSRIVCSRPSGKTTTQRRLLQRRCMCGDIAYSVMSSV